MARGNTRATGVAHSASMSYHSISTSPAARFEADVPASPLLIAAMLALCAIGYWSNHHFEDMLAEMPQGSEWCVDVAQSEESPVY